MTGMFASRGSSGRTLSEYSGLELSGLLSSSTWFTAGKERMIFFVNGQG